MNITFVGDVHGHKGRFFKVAQEALGRGDKVVQVGDMGLGFGHDAEWHPKPAYPDGVYFIRGNHDNPVTCRNSPNYLGEFGYSEELNIFFVSGAWSIDQSHRRENWSWWREEQLSMGQCAEALELWEKTKPDYVVTHDAPAVATLRILALLGGAPIPTRMGQLFDQMLAVHKPKVWLFGHWHITWDYEIDGTRFICLPELGPLTLDIPTATE